MDEIPRESRIMKNDDRRLLAIDAFLKVGSEHARLSGRAGIVQTLLKTH